MKITLKPPFSAFSTMKNESSIAWYSGDFWMQSNSKASIRRHILQFKDDAATPANRGSRPALTDAPGYFLTLQRVMHSPRHGGRLVGSRIWPAGPTLRSTNSTLDPRVQGDDAGAEVVDVDMAETGGFHQGLELLLARMHAD